MSYCGGSRIEAEWVLVVGFLCVVFAVYFCFLACDIYSFGHVTVFVFHSRGLLLRCHCFFARHFQGSLAFPSRSE